jgi:hypothetical protein
MGGRFSASAWWSDATLSVVMKVVLFSGGGGTRMRTAEDDVIPRPLQRGVMDLIRENGDLVGDACVALAGAGWLIGYRHDGLWRAANTFKERAELDVDHNKGIRPWMLWEPPECGERSA